MEWMMYPTKEAVLAEIHACEPILLLVAFDASRAIAAPIDEAVEHHILLARSGFDQRDIDKYFRVVVDGEGADWTFVCPPDYKNMTDKTRRIAEFYKDGFATIPLALKDLGCFVGIDIPKRYRRHFDIMSDQ